MSGKADLFPVFKKSPINFPWRSSVAYPNAMDHRSTIPKSWLTRTATSCEISQDSFVRCRARGRTNLFRSRQCVHEFALGDLRFGFSICYDLRFPEIYRNWPPSRTSAPSSSLLHGHFRETNIFGCSPGARDRKPELRHRVKPRRQRQRAMVLRQLRDHRSPRNRDRRRVRQIAKN